MSTRKSYLRKIKNWTKYNPNTHERTLMLEKCGKNCFLGSKKTFPICKKGTCTISPGGVQAAYIRAREMTRRARESTIKKHAASYYYNVAKKAKKLLRKTMKNP